MPLTPARRHLLIALAFTVLHYLATAAVFLSGLASIGGFDRPATTLSTFAASIPEPVFLGLCYLFLVPAGFLPFGILYNSALLGFGLYHLLDWRHERKTSPRT